MCLRLPIWALIERHEDVWSAEPSGPDHDDGAGGHVEPGAAKAGGAIRLA